MPRPRGGTHSWGLDSKADAGQDEIMLHRIKNRAAYQVANVRRSLGVPPYHELNIPFGAIESIVRSTGAEPWFVWAIQNRRIRGETNSAMDWIVEHIPKDKLIFEVGCGCGANLIWLAQRGYHNLVGTDRSSSAILAATQLADLAQRTISVHVADGFVPSEKLIGVEKIAVLLAIDCIYLAQFDMTEHLRLWRDRLASGGCVIFDMVDQSFDRFPNNQYMTDDWGLPEEKRRSTQYVTRISPDELRKKAAKTGFEMIGKLAGTEVPPRYVAVLQRVD
jgi:SAM-dependent methyltransferase